MEELKEVTNGHAVEIVVTIIGLLLTVIGFFLSFYFRRSIKTTDELSKSVTSLTATVSVLNETMRNYDEGYYLRHSPRGWSTQEMEVEAEAEADAKASKTVKDQSGYRWRTDNYGPYF